MVGFGIATKHHAVCSIAMKRSSSNVLAPVSVSIFMRNMGIMLYTGLGEKPGHVMALSEP